WLLSSFRVEKPAAALRPWRVGPSTNRRPHAPREENLSSRRTRSVRSTMLLLDGQAQAPGRPLDDAAGVIEVAGVEVIDLPLRDLAHLGRGDLEPLVLAA